MQLPDFDVNERVDKDIETILKPWKLPKARKICFTNCKVVDVVNNQIITDVNVTTFGGKIISISNARIDSSAEVIDCEGSYICPGLIDNHVHVQCVPGELDLLKLMLMPKTKAMTRMATVCESIIARGFTTVRDCGGTEYAIKHAVEEGSILGPRLIIAGHAISQTGGHGDMRPGDMPGDSFDSCACHMNLLGKVADGVPECYKAAREEMRRGANFIKMMGSGGVASPTDKITDLQYCDDEIQALVSVAKSYGTYVTAHAYTPASIQRCIKNGVKGIEHGNLIDDETAKMMAENDCYLTPTLVTYKVMASDQFSFFFNEDTMVKNRQVLYKGLESLNIAKRNKVKTCFGSDLLGPMGVYQTQEFFIRSKYLTAQEVLLSATVTPAECNGLGDKLGQVKENYIADIIMLSANPLEDVSILDEPEKYLKLVMKEGIIYKSAHQGVKSDVKSRFFPS